MTKAFKAISIIGVSSLLVASVAGGTVIGTAINTKNNETAQKQNEQQKTVKKVEKTNELGSVDEYTVTYDDNTTSLFIVTKGQDGKPKPYIFPDQDGVVPTVVIGENGNWNVNGLDSGVLAKVPAGLGFEERSITSITKTNTEGLIDTYTITYSDNTTSAFTVTNGENGAQGIQGVKGNDGHTPVVTINQEGYWVVDGVPTTTYAVGPQGPAGQNGKSAYEIAKDHGYTGTEEEWLASLIGEAGAAGVNGTNGNDGKSAYELAKDHGYTGTEEEWLASLVGAQGAAGQNGENGQNGQDGTNGKSAYELAQENGFTGSLAEWLVSLVGPEGAAGQNGTNGTNGKSAYELAVDAGYTGTLEQWLASLVGEAGAAGQNGQDGANGKSAYEIAKDHGYTGTEEEWLASLVGAAGAQGAAGQNGQDGANGKSAYELAVENGFQGSVTDWLASLKGEKGDAGRSIVSITEIDDGDNNEKTHKYQITYSEGDPSYFVVNDGADGANGAQGIQGVKGDDGHTPVITINAQGYWVIDGTATTTYAVGPKGDQGDPGQNGQDGKSILTGNGAPASSLGKTGDIYLDLTSLNLYKKTSTGWGSPVANIKGATGAAGQNGTNGTNGQDGAAGANGADGVSITNATIDSNGHLIVTLSDGNEIDAGSVRDIGNAHTVSFNSNDGSAVADIENVTNGTTITAPEAPTKSGYIFQGWYTSDGARWIFEKDVVTDDITLYAHWGKFKVENGVLTECTVSDKTVVVPAQVEGQIVTEIGASVFAYNTTMKTVVVPNTVYRINYQAFANCTNLEKAYLVNGLTTLNANVFTGCSELTYISIPETLTTINSYAFSYCASLQYLDFSKTSLDYLAYGTFKGSSVKKLVLPDNKEMYIELAALYGADQLVSLTVPNMVKRINYGTYSHLSYFFQSDINSPDPTLIPSSLEEVIVTGGVVEYTFTNCTNLKRVTIGDGVTLIRDKIFSGCTSLEEVTMPFDKDQLSLFGHYFDLNTNDTDNTQANIPASLKKVTVTGSAIPEYKFKDCTGIENIVVKDSVTSIGQGVFMGCTSLAELTVPFTGSEPNANEHCEIGFYFTDSSNLSYIDNACVSSLKTVTITGSSVQHKVGEGAFQGESCEIDHIVLGEQITTICYSAFGDHCKLKTINLDNVIEIQENAFYGAMYLHDIGSLDKVRTIGSSAFMTCHNLTDIDLSKAPLQVTSDDWFVFNGCANLKTVKLPASSSNFTRIARGWFEECLRLESIFIPNSVTAIDENAFKGCASLEMVRFHSAITSIASNAFANVPSVKYVLYHGGVGDGGFVSWASFKSRFSSALDSAFGSSTQLF